MSLDRLLKLVTEALGESAIPYMLTGSLAGSYHGAPRATQDIDLVVEAPQDRLLRLAGVLRDAGLYVDDNAVKEAARVRGMFNAVDPESEWKVDFTVPRDREFSRDEFSHRETIEFMGLGLVLVSASDLIVAKLEWAELGDSERQLRDVAEIVAVQGPQFSTARIVERRPLVDNRRNLNPACLRCRRAFRPLPNN